MRARRQANNGMSLLRWTIVAVSLVLAASPITTAQGPSKEQTIEALRGKVQTTTPPPEVKRIETVAQFGLRVRGRQTCSFEGTLVQEGERRELKASELPAECAQFREHVGTIFASVAQLSGVFLGNYAYELIGERLVDGDRQYWVRARARDPQENLYQMELWISWETGLIRDGVLAIRKPAADPITIVQTYYQEGGRWLLKSVRARTVARILLVIRIGIEVDIDVKSHRYFF
jgi:hypothetical protein